MIYSKIFKKDKPKLMTKLFYQFFNPIHFYLFPDLKHIYSGIDFNDIKTEKEVFDALELFCVDFKAEFLPLLSLHDQNKEESYQYQFENNESKQYLTELTKIFGFIEYYNKNELNFFPNCNPKDDNWLLKDKEWCNEFYKEFSLLPLHLIVYTDLINF